MSTQIIGFLDRKQLIDEAANWIAKLDAGHLSAADLSSLRAWAGTSKQHRDTLDQVASQWDELAILALNRTLASDQKQDIADDHSRWRGFANAAAVAGVTVLFGALGWFLQSTTTDATYVAANGQYATAIGEQRTVSLPDGSEVHVNTNSHLEVTYGDASRSLRLLQGEAFFNVAPDAEKPFVVRAGRGEVVAIGTAFAVRLETTESVRVTVSEGRVAVVRASSDARRLQPTETINTAVQVSMGETVVFDGATIDPLQTLDPPQLSGRLAWRDGMLRFTDESLSTVIAEVTRYTPREIVISDPSLRDLAFSGYFRTGDTAALLSTLTADFNITVTEVDGDVIYLQRHTR